MSYFMQNSFGVFSTGRGWDSDRIDEGLYLGSLGAAQDPVAMTKAGVTHVLSIMEGVNQIQRFEEKFNYLCIEAPDVEQQNIIQYFKATNEYIREAIKGGGIVLVHCRAGISRSTSLVCAYLMEVKRWSYTEALNHVRRIRTVIRPNYGFAQQLQVYHKMRWQVMQTHEAYIDLLKRLDAVDAAQNNVFRYTLPIVEKKDLVGDDELELDAMCFEDDYKHYGVFPRPDSGKDIHEKDISSISPSSTASLYPISSIPALGSTSSTPSSLSVYVSGGDSVPPEIVAAEVNALLAAHVEQEEEDDDEEGNDAEIEIRTITITRYTIPISLPSGNNNPDCIDVDDALS